MRIGSWIRCLFDPWILDPGRVENLDLEAGSGINNPDHFSESLKTILEVKNT
jgi:hypothetical protein